MENKETQIEKFDPSTLMKGVRDRIKATFVSLIPDAQWEELCKKEIDDFFAVQDNWTKRRDWTKMSDFQRVCFEVFEELTKEKIKKMLQIYTSETWENNKPKISEELKKLIIENSDAIFANVMSASFQQVVNSLRNNY